MKIFLLIITVLLLLSCTNNEDREMKQLYKIVSEVHSSIKTGTGNNDYCFSDEILKNKEGHCAHFSLLLAEKLLKNGYDFEFISIGTYTKAKHVLLQATLKSTKKKILLDANSNIIYKNDITKILDTPKLALEFIGESTFPMYTNQDFWTTIKEIKFQPYMSQLNGKYLLNIKELDSTDQFYPSPNGIKASFDENYDTYSASKAGQKEPINILVKFTNKVRIRSLLIKPYAVKDYPSFIKIQCINKENEKTIFSNSISLKRGLIVINLLGNDYCQKLDMQFSKFIGQQRLLLRDIYIYGK